MNFTTDDERGSRRQLRIPMRMTMSLQKTRTIDDGVEQEDEECSTMTPFPRVRGCDHMIPVLLQLLYVWLSKLWSLFGSLLSYGTYYLGYPKRDPNSDSHPHILPSCQPETKTSTLHSSTMLCRPSEFWPTGTAKKESCCGVGQVSQ